jgi:hypothetical protein
MGQTTALACHGLGHYRSRHRVQADGTGVDQLVVDVLAESALHAGNEISVVIYLFEQVA